MTLGNKIIGFGLVVLAGVSVWWTVSIGLREEARLQTLELRVEQLEDDARELKQANPGITTNND